MEHVEAPTLTQYDEQTDENCGQRAHAQPQYLLLLHQLTVGAGKAAGAHTLVPLVRVAVHARAAVETRVVEALVPVLAPLAVRRDTLTPGTPVGGRSAQKCLC